MLKLLLSLSIFFTLLTSNCLGLTKPTFKPAVKTIYLNAQNVVIFDRAVDMVAADTFYKAVIGARSILPIDKTLYIIIVSPGGEYTTGLQIMKFLKEIPNTQLICKYCASMAGQIFAATGLKRLVINKTVLMMHEMVLPRVTAFMAQDKNLMNSLIKDSEKFNAVMYKMIGISRDEYEAKILNDEWNLEGIEVVDNHLADELVNIQCDYYVSRIAPQTCSK